MNKNWLTDRLTPSRKKTPLWADLTAIVQRLLHRYVSPLLTRLFNRVSLFDMEKEDLDRLLFELGDFFIVTNMNDDDLPLIIMQRQDLIHQKKTIYPMITTLRREFKGVNILWEPLYAPISEPYGSLFLVKSETTDNKKWFLTSRGIIQVPLSRSIRTNLDDFKDRIERIIYPLIPLRIVCHGVSLKTQQTTTTYIGSVSKVAGYYKIGPRPPQPNVFAHGFVIPFVTTYEHIEIKLK